MARRRRKIGISVSREVLADAERLCRETGESRSAVCERALVSLLEGRRRADLSRRYVEGYRRLPEDRSEAGVALATAMMTLGVERWDEAG